VNDIETTLMPLPVNDNTGSTHVTTTSNHDYVSRLELYVIDDLVVDEIEFNSVVHLDVWVGVSNGSTVVGDDVGDTLGTELVNTDFEELVGGFLGSDSVDGESTLDVVKKTEVFTGSLEGDDVHEPSWVSLISPDLSINLDNPLSHNSSNLTTGQSVLESVSEEDGERKGFTELVRTWGWSWGIGTRQFVEHP